MHELEKKIYESLNCFLCALNTIDTLEINIVQKIIILVKYPKAQEKNSKE